MAQAALQTATAPRHSQPKWFNSPVTFHEGTLAEIRQHIPSFERRRFGLTQPGDRSSRVNERLDTIVRLPFGEDDNYVPIGVVSSEYALVSHIEVLDVATAALETAKICPSEVRAELEITEYGERMALSIYMPNEYVFDPGDGHPMSLRVECFNSVDGSTRFRVLMGWFRFVCSNGLIIGVTRSDLRRRHVGDCHLGDVASVLASGLGESEKEKRNFATWRQRPIDVEQLTPWADKPLRKAWGFKAAARALHIARTGRDAKIVGEYKNNKPTTIPVESGKPVPGSPHECRSLFDVSQILAWLAQQRRDVQEQLEWREQIPGLLKSLTGRNRQEKQCA